MPDKLEKSDDTLQTFDYIIVGAGTAGCVLAARLSEDPSIDVCLIEAGGSEKHPYISIPAAVGCAIMNPAMGWGLKTVPQEALGGRQVPLPRGRIIGGCGSINGMAYYRGDAHDYDDWASEGNSGWDYASLLPYFLRSEHNPEFRDSPYHNTGGPMGVSFIPKPNRLCESFNDAMKDLGFPYCDDFNAPHPNGYGYRQGTIWKGKRVSTASTYLRPAMKRRNLTVLKHTHTRRVLFDGKRAVGVEVQAADGIKRYGAGKEVIISGGAYHSPHILMHSGVGDSSHLEDVGIGVVHHLPGVGKNLHDHPSTYTALDMRDSTSYGISWKAMPRDVLQFFLYALFRRGPMASNLFETNAYIKTMPYSDRPDMQLVFQPARRNIKPFPIPLNHGYAVATVCLYPLSRGSVTLASNDPLEAPLIDLALGQQKEDIQTLVRGLKLARQVSGHDSFGQYAATERVPGVDIQNDDELEAYVRETLTTVHHPGSSCRMGSGPNDVVDAELRVHGLEGLRVADASIYPHVPGANTNASVVAIAEKAADMILSVPAPEPLKVSM
jgi:choline dehydrogenase